MGKCKCDHSDYEVNEVNAMFQQCPHAITLEQDGHKIQDFFLLKFSLHVHNNFRQQLSTESIYNNSINISIVLEDCINKSLRRVFNQKA